MRVFHPCAFAIVTALALAAPAQHSQAEGFNLAGSEWQPVGAKPSGPRPFITFRSNGSLSGSDGCNSLRGTYRQKGSLLRFSRIASTRKMCLRPVMRRAQAFTRALGATRRFEASHLKLTLKNSAGRVLLRLRRRDFD